MSIWFIFCLLLIFVDYLCESWSYFLLIDKLRMSLYVEIMIMYKKNWNENFHSHLKMKIVFHYMARLECHSDMNKSYHINIRSSQVRSDQIISISISISDRVKSDQIKSYHINININIRSSQIRSNQIESSFTWAYEIK